jgi:5-methylcytosine-specific restriction endonuclease McrA
MTKKDVKRSKYPDLTGKVFDRLTVLGKHDASSWVCECSCGSRRNIKRHQLTAGKAKSCGCKKRESQFPLGQPEANAVYSNYLRNAETRSLSFDIPSDVFFDLIVRQCHYCGAPPSNVMKGRNRSSVDFVYSGLDRLDGSKGYLIENVVPCCFVCNRAKSDLTEDAFLEWISNLVANVRKKSAIRPSSELKEYLIPFAPVSLNHAYSTRVMRKGKRPIPIRYLQPNYKAFKSAVVECLEEQGALPFDPPFAICFLFLMEHSSFFYKKGTLRKRDLTNFFKLLEDACSEHWGVDDKENLLIVGHKRWVPDGELNEFIEDAYKSPPHKDLRAIIKLVVTPLPKDFGKYDGKLVPDTSVLE